MVAVEQKHMFIRGFQPAFISRIAQRLQLLNPNHHPDNAFSIRDVFEAAQFLLQGSTFFPVEAVVSATTMSPTLGGALLTSALQIKQEAPSIKTEDIFALINRFTQTLETVTASANTGWLNPNIQAAPIAQIPATAMGVPRPGPLSSARCNFCRDPSHFISRCPVVEQYIQQGKIRYSPEGKVILSGGSWILRNMEGQWLQDKVDTWHRLNLGQLVFRHLMSNMNDDAGIKPNNTPLLFFGIRSPSKKSPELSELVSEPAGVMLSTTEDMDQRITALQQEIMALHARKKKIVFDRVEIPSNRHGLPQARPQTHQKSPRSGSCSVTKGKIKKN
jgi:uncharacterized small protein (DUF1192 family)